MTVNMYFSSWYPWVQSKKRGIRGRGPVSAAAGSNRKQGRLAPLFIPGRLSGAAPKGGKIFGAELEDECICVDEEGEGTVIADRHHGVVRANEA